MKKATLMKYDKLLGIPALTAVLGLILAANPDSATALITKLLGWLLILGGAVKAVSMADRNTASRPSGWIWTAVFIVLGILLLKKPLILARSLGSLIGILLVIYGGRELRESAHKGGRILSIVLMVVGAILIAMPMSLTRTILRLCGIVVTVISVLSIAEKFREMKLLEGGSDPKIIDADE